MNLICAKNFHFTNTGFQKLISNSLVHPDSPGHLFHVGSCSFTEGTYRVNTADSLRKKSICYLKKQKGGVGGYDELK